MKETAKLGFILFLFTAIAAGVLALTNDFTGPIIAEIEKEASFGALIELFPEGEDFEEIDEGSIEAIQEKHPQIVEGHEVLKGGEAIGYSFQTESSGYGDEPIVAITAINSDGTLAGISVVSHTETPGFGEAIEEPSFQETFKEKSAQAELVAVESPEEDNEVMMISGSTITTTGILSGVNSAREAYLENFSD